MGPGPVRVIQPVQPGWDRAVGRPGRLSCWLTFSQGLPSCSEQDASLRSPELGAGLAFSRAKSCDSLSCLTSSWVLCWISRWKMAWGPGAVCPYCSSTTGTTPRSRRSRSQPCRRPYALHLICLLGEIPARLVDLGARLGFQHPTRALCQWAR